MKTLKTLPFILMLLLMFVTTSNNKFTEISDQKKLDGAITILRTNLEKELGHDVPSISVLLETPKGIYFTSSVGKNGKAITQDTYFRFASNTKNFTAAAILNMMQDGWLNIDEKIVANIPNSTQSYVPNTPEWAIPHKNEITIKQLLQHNAGVYDVDNDPVPSNNGDSYVDNLLKTTLNHQFSSTELVNQVTINNLTYGPPNTVYHYSNTGYTMLGEIISRVYSARSGKSKTYGDYLKDKIYGSSSKIPLNLHFADQATDQQLPSPYITGMIQNPTNTKITDKINTSPHVAEGNGVGTMSQLNRYVRTMMKGENVLAKKYITMMQNDQGIANKSDNHYGLGCTNNNILGYGHNGATEGYLSTMMYDPKTDVSVIVVIPYWDLTDGNNSLGKCLKALVNAAISGRQAIGYP